ncbi:MAG: hypothetical protein ABIJ10_05190, partial [Candidatus Micrarchaeota archaeon]
FKPFLRNSLMPETLNGVVEQLKQIGITEHDALVIADCVITRKSCSWVNIDPVDEAMIRDLKDLVDKENYKIDVKVQPIPTRSKFIWEVKVL